MTTALASSPLTVVDPLDRASVREASSLLADAVIALTRIDLRRVPKGQARDIIRRSRQDIAVLSSLLDSITAL